VSSQSHLSASPAARVGLSPALTSECEGNLWTPVSEPSHRDGPSCSSSSFLGYKHNCYSTQRGSRVSKGLHGVKDTMRLVHSLWDCLHGKGSSLSPCILEPLCFCRLVLILTNTYSPILAHFVASFCYDLFLLGLNIIIFSPSVIPMREQVHSFQ
jgi:hypothetical protein